MTTKSKSYVTEQKSFNPELTNLLLNMIDDMHKLYDNCVSQVAGAFIVSSFVRVFAQQKNYLDNLRKNADEAVKSGDKYQIKRSIYRLNNALDNKAFDYAWSSISQMYDSLISSTIDGQTSDALVGSFKTADEILEDVRKYSLAQDKIELNEDIKTLQALINL